MRLEETCFHLNTSEKPPANAGVKNSNNNNNSYSSSKYHKDQLFGGENCQSATVGNVEKLMKWFIAY